MKYLVSWATARRWRYLAVIIIAGNIAMLSIEGPFFWIAALVSALSIVLLNYSRARVVGASHMTALAASGFFLLFVLLLGTIWLSHNRVILLPDWAVHAFGVAWVAAFLGIGVFHGKLVVGRVKKHPS